MRLKGPPASSSSNDQVATFYDPVKNVTIPVNDHDAMIDAWERIDRLCAKLNSHRMKLRLELWNRTTGNAKTRRLRGHRRVAKLVEADDNLDQKKLKDANSNFPEFAEEFLRIERLAIKKREFKKAKETEGTERFNQFRELVKSAVGKPTGLPKITIEE